MFSRGPREPLMIPNEERALERLSGQARRRRALGGDGVLDDTESEAEATGALEPETGRLEVVTGAGQLQTGATVLVAADDSGLGIELAAKDEGNTTLIGPLWS
jgi:hypothetical protein